VDVNKVRRAVAARWREIYPHLSVADALAFERTLLAVERTYLAYLRTSMAVGLAGLTSWGVSTSRTWQGLGVAGATVAILLMLLAGVRFRHARAEWMHFAEYAVRRVEAQR
jgi:uncharacterized membrane protein YidH (DUF202 family)